MPITVRCACGEQLRFADAFAGKRASCPTCKASLLVGPVPAPDTSARADQSPPATCPTCGAELRAEAKFCPRCGQALPDEDPPPRQFVPPPAGNRLIPLSTLQKRRLLSAFAIGAAIMLLAALGSWPYGYFMLLRWVACFAAVLVAVLSLEWKHIWAVVVFAFVAVLFNPLVPLHLSRSIWRPIDIAAAVLFILATALVKPRVGRQPGGPV